MLANVVRASVAALAMVLAALPAAAQTFPTRPIRIVVPFPPGSATDLTARPLAQHITDTTGQNVLIDNRAGAEGQLGAGIVAQSKPDGYTLLVSTQTTQAMNPSVYKKLPYHAVDSFAPVTGIRRGALVALARKDLGIADVKALIARAKAEPGKLTFGSGNGSSRAGGEYFKLLAGVDLLHVPYKGQPQAMQDLAGGRLDLTWSDMYTGLPFIRDGRALAIGVSSSARMPHLPDVPTIAEGGVAGYELWAWTAVFAPAGTPRPIIDRLNQLFHAAIRSPAFQEQSLRSGAVLFPGTPEDLAAFQVSEIDKWGRIIRAAGMQEP